MTLRSGADGNKRGDGCEADSTRKDGVIRLILAAEVALHMQHPEPFNRLELGFLDGVQPLSPGP